MISEIKPPDPQRWRKGFALFPKRIGDRRIWLEWYAWRELTSEEEADLPRTMFVGLTYRECREYILKCDGYTAWRIRHHFLMSMLGSSSTDWVRPRVKLKVVGA